METIDVTREREKRRKEGNNYLVGGENRKNTQYKKKKLTRSLPFFVVACDDIISRD